MFCYLWCISLSTSWKCFLFSDGSGGVLQQALFRTRKSPGRRRQRRTLLKPQVISSSRQLHECTLHYQCLLYFWNCYFGERGLVCWCNYCPVWFLNSISVLDDMDPTKSISELSLDSGKMAYMSNVGLLAPQDLLPCGKGFWNLLLSCCIVLVEGMCCRWPGLWQECLRRCSPALLC